MMTRGPSRRRWWKATPARGCVSSLFAARTSPHCGARTDMPRVAGLQHSRGWHRASHRHYAMAQILLRRVYRAEGIQYTCYRRCVSLWPRAPIPPTHPRASPCVQCTVLRDSFFRDGHATQRGELARGSGYEILQTGTLCGSCQTACAIIMTLRPSSLATLPRCTSVYCTSACTLCAPILLSDWEVLAFST